MMDRSDEQRVLQNADEEQTATAEGELPEIFSASALVHGRRESLGPAPGAVKQPGRRGAIPRHCRDWMPDALPI